MPLPLAAIAAGAARVGSIAGRAGSAVGKGTGRAGKLFKGRGMPSAGGKAEEREKPEILSAGGVIMFFSAFCFDAINIALVFLDLAFFLGTIIAIGVNFLAMIIIGIWIYKHTGQLPIKKALLPFGLNSLPIVRFIPWWMISVWLTCKK